MKTIILISLLALTCHAASVNLDWFRNPEPNVTNYRIYYGTATGVYTYSANAGNETNITITGLSSGVTYFFVATAINDAGRESRPSTEINYTVPGSTGPPSSPLMLNAAPEGDWSMVWEFSPKVTGPWQGVATNTFTVTHHGFWRITIK